MDHVLIQIVADDQGEVRKEVQVGLTAGKLPLWVCQPLEEEQ